MDRSEIRSEGPFLIATNLRATASSERMSHIEIPGFHFFIFQLY